jgi:electron transport complex protein RnfB
MPEDEPQGPERMTRRKFLTVGGKAASVLAAGGVAALAARRAVGGETVWQIDPYACTQCGNCATYCVLTPSAVKCVHAFELCGYCDFCTGFFEMDSGASGSETGAENQLCPAGAIVRSHVESGRYEYIIDEALCIGCAKCVEGCTSQGNGSLYLQVMHDRCINCNECAIAAACPSDAFRRLRGSETLYLHKGRGH